MQNEGSHGSSGPAAKFPAPDQDNAPAKVRDSIRESASEVNNSTPALTIVVCNGDSSLRLEQMGAAQITLQSGKEDSPKKGYLSRNSSSHEQCRVCQQEKEEALIELGCQCRGGLAKAHRSCIDAWFRTKGSNQCEICQVVAANVSPPETQPTTNYWVWRIDPSYRQEQRERGCFSPLWVAFSILIGGLMLDVLISITLGVSALPVNIIIGVIVVLGLGTALRLTLEFCYEWSLRRAVHRAVQRAEASFNNITYPPAL
ncbi:PREDICTED: E3 ubiquitin-protein ligase MARCH3 [Tarenaya hassleriana]|uniref:E3 ubiquitin-protein ligase MARCH3 n=1 Tax=Tarenaya hassleriana TaxID=28532 RepID=UPI00053C59EA|nr:PREDICTED: E3 ubiquitin-protein ligase MARCH3 [Tarenaya hassleriana]XP_010553567.1 PREDICTED: E3 ubiquitin-protein ligase MARCH3 [Tarenaya hassleriana]XP_010553569.1 PREDICTED: E3 ubiquitin-protein ligase MARCH3 [Tarenaya hassleriana]XP_010553570.1 PREDICTED: E3 ubiquitin-protein ligase MARCH3 [Tarenaya hassleriana]